MDGAAYDGEVLTRRQFVVWGATSATIAGLATSCSSSRPAATGDTAAKPDEDFSTRFSNFQPADEPNGDISKVDWPTFVTDAGPEVKSLYEFQITHGELMRYMPCFCGCGQNSGHRSNRDCYVTSVNADGSVVLDSMAPT